jgi:hypothetical protein
MKEMVQSAFGLVFNLSIFALLSYLVLQQIFWHTALLLSHELVALRWKREGCAGCCYELLHVSWRSCSILSRDGWLLAKLLMAPTATRVWRVHIAQRFFLCPRPHCSICFQFFSCDHNQIAI